MAHVKADRVQETTTSTGTGALTLAGATTKFRAFSAALADTDTCVCLIEHASAAEWEVSLCTFASGAGTLTRSTIYASSNAGSAVNFSAGTKTISLLPAAAKMIVADNTGATTIPGALLPASNDGGAIGSATLSFSDLFLADGAVINFNNGNYTITHSAGNIAFASAGGNVTFTTTGTNGARKVFDFNGVNSSPAANDEVYGSYLLTSSTPAQVEFGRLSLRATTVTASSEESQFRFLVRSAGSLTTKLILTGTALTPGANDATALGTASTSFSDAFLASGAVINFANGNFTITHSSATLTIGEAMNLAFGTTTGTKIGTSTSQKIGFFNATPIVKPTGVAVDAASIHAALVSLGLIAA